MLNRVKNRVNIILPFKPICERRFIRRNGTSLIYIHYYFGAEKQSKQQNVAISTNSISMTNYSTNVRDSR